MRDRRRQAARQAGNDRDREGRELVVISDRARENREYVRTLLKNTQPEFAALLEWLERDLPCLACEDAACRARPASGAGDDGERAAGRRGRATELVRCSGAGVSGHRAARPATGTGTAQTAASVQDWRALAMMPDRRRRAMLVETRTGNDAA